jgi:hypothetical protein
VSLNIDGLPLSESITVVFHGREDLSTVHTYVTQGSWQAGESVSKDELLRIPCDLDLGTASGRDEAEVLYAEQASALRDALIGADTVLDLWREQLTELLDDTVAIDRSLNLELDLPVHRLLPSVLMAKERQLVVAAVCGARTLSQGRPPLGIVCAQQDVSRVYPLLDDPARCLHQFSEAVAEHTEQLREYFDRQAVSVQRFLELSEPDSPQDQ